VSLIAGRQLSTVAQTDHTAEQVDHIQRETGQGPCLAAAMPGAPASIVVDDMHGEARWPAYATRVAGLGVGSMIAFPRRANEPAQLAQPVRRQAPRFHPG
jgi:hypothetical protein